MALATPRIEHHSTDDLRPQDRFGFWADELGRKIGLARYDSPHRSDFWQSLAVLDTGPICVMRAQGSGVDLYRSQHSLFKDAADYSLQLIFKLGGEGASLIEQSQQKAVFQAGDLVVNDSRRALRLSSGQSTDSLLVGLAAPLVERWLGPAEQIAAHKVDTHKGWGAMLAGYLRGLQVDHLANTTGLHQQTLVADHVLSLLSFAMEQEGLLKNGESVSPRDKELHGRMLACIREHYADTEFDASALAARFNVSVRYVHKVFAAEGRGSTFLGTLRQERLQAADRLLRVAGTSMSVADIAWRCGFADPVNFGRVFRQKNGITPGALARQRDGVREATVPRADATVLEPALG